MSRKSSIQYGVQTTLIGLTDLSSETVTKSLTLQSSAAIITLHAPALTGDLQLDIYSSTGNGIELLKRSEILSVPSQLVEYRVNDLMGEVRVELTTAATATAEVKLKAVHSIDDSSDDERDGINESALVVQNPLIQNVATIADTEVAINFPAGTKRFLVKARGNSKAQFSYVNGGSGTTYWTEFPGFTLDEVNVDRQSTTIYVQTSKNDVLEIKSWA